MYKRTRLERRTLAFLHGVCTRVRSALQQHWSNPKELDVVLEMCRKMAEQVWRATHDPLNVWATGEEHRTNPQVHRNGAEWCVERFIRLAGNVFNREFENGLI
ncbi:MAG: hypothetical protein KBD24_03695 [Candidatus Pacebacteria bacterium]|nr:hypothetical protein [Candidatus Paceibacterota bacterium]